MEPIAAPPVRTYLFMSFDLVNSTIFKQHHSEKWASETSEFYRSAAQGVLARLPRASVWKYAGDEILFYCSAQNVEEVKSWVTSGYEILGALDQQVAQRSDAQLRVKGICWAALASTEQSTGLAAPNVVFIHASDAGGASRDFLGPEIDAGFRLGGSTCQRTLALSAELAAFLIRFTPEEVTKYIHFVSLQKLKGVWKNKLYPICWYRHDLHDGFQYDDQYENPLLAEALNKPRKNSEIRSIVEEVKPGYVDKLQACLSAEPETVSAPPKLSVHCAAVVQAPDGKVLVARRSKTKATYPDTWEFGCAQLRPGESFEDAVIREYKEDFNLTVGFDEQRRVFNTYSFERDGVKHPGIVIQAQTATPTDCKPVKHAKFKWIDPANPPSDVTEKCVPDLPQVLARVSSPASPAGKYPKLPRPR